jgi:hypothetical protein
MSTGGLEKESLDGRRGALTTLDERYVGMAVYVECFVPATELSFSRSPSLSQWVSPLWTRGTWAWRCTWSVSCPPQSSLSLVLLLSLSGSHPFGREVRGHGGVRGVFRARHGAAAEAEPREQPQRHHAAADALRGKKREKKNPTRQRGLVGLEVARRARSGWARLVGVWASWVRDRWVTLRAVLGET